MQQKYIVIGILSPTELLIEEYDLETDAISAYVHYRNENDFRDLYLIHGNIKVANHTRFHS